MDTLFSSTCFSLHISLQTETIPFSIDELLAKLFQFGSQELLVTIISIIGILIAVANCFAGYKFIKIWIQLLGTIFGAAIGYIGVSFLTSNVLIQASVVVVAAVIFWFISKKLLTAGIVLLCAVMAFTFSYYFLICHFGYAATDNASFWIALVFGVLCGLLAHLIHRPVIIAVTALCGSYTAWTSLCSLIYFYCSSRTNWIVIGTLALAGGIVQFVTTKS